MGTKSLRNLPRVTQRSVIESESKAQHFLMCNIPEGCWLTSKRWEIHTDKHHGNIYSPLFLPVSPSTEPAIYIQGESTSDLSSSWFSFRFSVVLWIPWFITIFFSVYSQCPDSREKRFLLFGKGVWCHICSLGTVRKIKLLTLKYGCWMLLLRTTIPRMQCQESLSDQGLKQPHWLFCAWSPKRLLPWRFHCPASELCLGNMQLYLPHPLPLCCQNLVFFRSIWVSFRNLVWKCIE